MWESNLTPEQEAAELAAADKALAGLFELFANAAVFRPCSFVS